LSVKRTFCGKRAINGDRAVPADFSSNSCARLSVTLAFSSCAWACATAPCFGLDIGLKGRALKFVEEICGLNVCALGKQPFRS